MVTASPNGAGDAALIEKANPCESRTYSKYAQEFDRSGLDLFLSARHSVAGRPPFRGARDGEAAQKSLSQHLAGAVRGDGECARREDSVAAAASNHRRDGEDRGGSR